jgi:hypothetical protein
VKAVNFPSIDAGSPGHIAITFPGTTSGDAKDKTRPWNYYMAVSTNALAPLPTFHSATANKLSDPIHRGACNGRCAGMYDFLDAVLAPNGEAWGTAVDTCTAVCATDAGAPKDAQAIVVRQLSGPGARKR